MLSLRVALEHIRFRGQVARAKADQIETIRFSTNRDETTIVANGTRSLAYSLEFDNPIGGGIDLILTFDSPDSSYAFFDLKSAP